MGPSNSTSGRGSKPRGHPVGLSCPGHCPTSPRAEETGLPGALDLQPRNSSGEHTVGGHLPQRGGRTGRTVPRWRAAAPASASSHPRRLTCRFHRGRSAGFPGQGAAAPSPASRSLEPPVEESGDAPRSESPCDSSGLRCAALPQMLSFKTRRHRSSGWGEAVRDLSVTSTRTRTS